MRSRCAMHVVLACLALLESSMLWAQARSPASEPPAGVTVRVEDQLSKEEERRGRQIPVTAAA